MDATQQNQHEDPIYLIIEPPSASSNNANNQVENMNGFFEKQMSLDGENNNNPIIESGDWSPGPPDGKTIIADSFTEMVTDHPVERKTPLVVLDSANIGWCFGEGAFSARGLQLAVDYFQKQNVEIKAFLPAYYVQQKPTDGSRHNSVMETDEISYLQSLIRSKILALVPSGESDDAYIIQYARNYSGFIITNDMFRDHMNSLSENSMKLSLQLWLAENRVGFTFADHHFLINPNSLLSTRLQQLQDEQAPNNNLHDRRLSHSQSQNNFFVQPANKAILSITKTISEYHRLHRYNDVKVLILMKSRLLLDMERYQECYDEIQSILLYVDPHCVESKQILSVLQEKTRSVLPRTSSREEEFARAQHLPAVPTHLQQQQQQSQHQFSGNNQSFANRAENQMIFNHSSSRGEDEKNRFDPRTPTDSIPPSFRHVSENRSQLQQQRSAMPPGNQLDLLIQQQQQLAAAGGGVPDAQRHQMLLENFVPGPLANQQQQQSSEPGSRQSYQQYQQRQQHQQQQQQHRQRHQMQQMQQQFRSAPAGQDLSSFSSSPHHHQQQQQQQQHAAFPPTVSPSNRQMNQNSFRPDTVNPVSMMPSRSPRQPQQQIGGPGHHQFQHQFQQQQAQLERAAAEQFSQQQQKREGSSINMELPYSPYQQQQQQQPQFAEFASNRPAAFSDSADVQAYLLQQQRDRAVQQFTQQQQQQFSSENGQVVDETFNGPPPAPPADAYEAWLARK